MAQRTHSSTGTMKSICFAITLLLITPLPASANSPESIEGVPKLSAEEVVDLAGNDLDLTIVDSRVPDDRKLGYIEGSISLPNTDTSCESLAEILPEKDSHVLFYCNGIKCGRSAKAINIAKICGYSGIFWFRGGFEEWLAKGFPYLQE